MPVRLWLRRFRARPAAGAFVLISLSVSMAGGLAALSVISAVLWRALPFRDADSLVTLELRTQEHRTRWWSGPELQTVAKFPPPPFVDVAGYTVADVNVLSDHGRPPEALLGTLVSADFFRTLGVGVQLGRGPAVADYFRGSPRVVVLGHELWQRRYGAGPSIIGRTIRLSSPAYLGEPNSDYQVIGVLRGDAWLFWKRTDLVLPLRSDSGALADPRRHLVERVIGRLDSGATIAAARMRAPQLLNRVTAAASDARVAGIVIDRLKSTLFRNIRPQLLLVLMIAIVVLVLAGSNVMIGASAEALERQRETAVRLAIGAAPGHIVFETCRHLALTVTAACAISVMLTFWFIGVFLAYVPPSWVARVPGTTQAFHIDAGVVAALALAAAGVVCTTGVWTYRWSRRLASGHLLASVQPIDTRHRQRWRALLVGIEISLCAATAIVATALLSRVWHLRAVDLGVRADRTFAGWINASPTAYADSAVRAAYFQRLIEEIQGVPGVEVVGGIDLSFQFEWQTTTVRTDGDRSKAPYRVLDRVATSKYLEASGMTDGSRALDRTRRSPGRSGRGRHQPEFGRRALARS